MKEYLNLFKHEKPRTVTARKEPLPTLTGNKQGYAFAQTFVFISGHNWYIIENEANYLAFLDKVCYIPDLHLARSVD